MDTKIVSWRCKRQTMASALANLTTQPPNADERLFFIKNKGRHAGFCGPDGAAPERGSLKTKQWTPKSYPGVTNAKPWYSH